MRSVLFSYTLQSFVRTIHEIGHEGIFNKLKTSRGTSACIFTPGS